MRSFGSKYSSMSFSMIREAKVRPREREQHTSYFCGRACEVRRHSAAEYLYAYPCMKASP